MAESIFISMLSGLSQRSADGRCSLSVQEGARCVGRLLPGSGNVYRFPVEIVAKPTADLLRSVAADVREVSLVAEAFGLEEPPMDVRNASDRAIGGADRRDDVLAEGRQGEESGDRGDAETARRAGAPNVPGGARGGLAIGRRGREVREHRARGRVLAEAAQGRVRLWGDGMGAAAHRCLCGG